jgi:MFS family permease
MGVSDVLWLDAASFLVSAAAVAAFVPGMRPVSASADVPRVRFLTDVRAGWRFLFGDPLLRAIATIAVAINFLATPLFAVLLPVMVKREYGSAGDLGLALAALAGGGVVGALLYAAVGVRVPRRPVLVGGFAFGALPLIVLAWAPPLWVTLVALAACGLGLGPLNPLVMTVMQERVPTELRARVIGAVTATAMVAAPAGVLIAGGLAEVLDVQVLIGVVAVGLFLLTIPILLSRPLRDIGGVAGSSASAMLPPVA